MAPVRRGHTTHSAEWTGHAAINGSFTPMEFAEFTPVAYLESQAASVFLEEHVETEVYQRILAALADTALDEGESRKLIATLANEGLRGSRGS